jgi:hypothetical protein
VSASYKYAGMELAIKAFHELISHTIYLFLNEYHAMKAYWGVEV